ERLRDVLRGAQRIALLGCDAMPFGVRQSLLNPLIDGGWQLSSGDAVAYTFRSVKTDAEQVVIDEAYRIARAGLEEVAHALRPGVSEREIAAAAESAMRHAG